MFQRFFSFFVWFLLFWDKVIGSFYVPLAILEPTPNQAILALTEILLPLYKKACTTTPDSYSFMCISVSLFMWVWALTESRRASVPLKLELQVAANPQLWVLGTWTPVSLYTGLSLRPTNHFMITYYKIERHSNFVK